jgi:hypothetical protein
VRARKRPPAHCPPQGGRREILAAHSQEPRRLPHRRHLAREIQRPGADNSDDDNFPVGDKHNGDGLTLYEEYRGYVHRDEWSDLNPNVKDFFVINNIAGYGVEGIRAAEDASKLKIHELDFKGEHNGFRVVNFNSQYAHRVDQHATLLEQGSRREYSEAVGSGFGRDNIMGTPKDFDFVSMAGGPGEALPVEDIPHELFHTCNTYHHGEHDLRAAWTVKTGIDGRLNIYPATLVKNDDGTVTYDTSIVDSRIKLFLESNPDVEIDNPRVLLQSKGMQVRIGMPHGQNSGNETCHMRYNNAMVYPKGDSTTEFFWVWGADLNYTPQLLCTAPDGYAFNHANHKPQPRFFEADTGCLRGDCAGQLLVNDAINAPRRMNPQKPSRK